MVSRRELEEALTPPLPFAEAERKADPNGAKHSTVPGPLPIGLFGRFSLQGFDVSSGPILTFAYLLGGHFRQRRNQRTTGKCRFPVEFWI